MATVVGRSNAQTRADGQSTSKGKRDELSSSLKLQIFQQACIELINAGFRVLIEKPSSTSETRIRTIGAGWCQHCKNLKTSNEMAEVGLCQHCKNQAVEVPA